MRRGFLLGGWETVETVRNDGKQFSTQLKVRAGLAMGVNEKVSRSIQPKLGVNKRTIWKKRKVS